MIWHIITTSGKADDFQPPLRADEPRLSIALSDGGNPVRMREHALDLIWKEVGRTPSETHRDLLAIAMSVYAADLSVPRELAEDGWTREFKIYIPVENPKKWSRASKTLQRTLSFLSGDIWEFVFRGRESTASANQGERPEFDTVCLFSGGLDSLTGGIDLLERGKKVLLVGHYGAGATSKFQKDVYAELKRVYGEAALALRFHVLPPAIERSKSDLMGEETQRTRSFLFFALGLAVAGTIEKTTPLFIPENGIISLNVPMTSARSGSASTRTTHPYYVKCMRELLAIIGMKHELVLPYRFRTKAEMLCESENPDLLRKLTPLSISCAHPDQRRREGLKPGGHCGHCFPCLIRRATVASAGFPDASYDTDVLTNIPSATTKKGSDYRAVRMAIERLKNIPEHRILFEVMKAGPLDPSEVRQFVEVYERGMRELASFYK